MLGAERAKFTSAAQMVVKELSEAGGVERALQICLQTAAAGKA